MRRTGIIITILLVLCTSFASAGLLGDDAPFYYKKSTLIINSTITNNITNYYNSTGNDTLQSVTQRGAITNVTSEFSGFLSVGAPSTELMASLEVTGGLYLVPSDLTGLTMSDVTDSGVQNLVDTTTAGSLDGQVKYLWGGNLALQGNNSEGAGAIWLLRGDTLLSKTQTLTGFKVYYDDLDAKDVVKDYWCDTTLAGINGSVGNKYCFYVSDGSAPSYFGSSVGVKTTNTSSYSLNVNGTINANTYLTNGTDYAEVVEKLNHTEALSPGDVVGVLEGKITKNTLMSHDYAVVSGNSVGVLGGDNSLVMDVVTSYYQKLVFNEMTQDSEWVTLADTKLVMPVNFDNKDYVPVAFTGQVRAKVCGAVYDGYWIIANGSSGCAYAMNFSKSASTAELITAIGKRVGVAWETNLNPGAKLVKIRVGLR